MNELVAQVGAAANAGGVVFLLVAALIGRHRQWWIDGPTHKDVVKDRDEWKRLALRGMSAAEKATTVAEKATSK